MKNTKTRLQTLNAGGYVGESQEERDKRVMTQQDKKVEKNSLETLQKQADEADMLLPFPELNAKQEFSEVTNQEKTDMLPNFRNK